MNSYGASVATTSGCSNFQTQTMTTRPERKPRSKIILDTVGLSPIDYSCELCSFKGQNEGQLLKHVLIHGKANIIHMCDKCGFSSVSFNHYSRHLMSHSDAVFKCPECPFQTDEAKQLSKHVALKHAFLKIPPIHNASSVLQCNECPYTTTKIYHFERHLLVHNRELKGLLQIYRCAECPYKTHRKEHFYRHRNNIHTRSRPHQCGYCRRSYKNLDTLRRHEKSSHLLPRSQGQVDSGRNLLSI